MKNRIIISSILTIVLCFSLIVGSTFALFTSEDQFDISITAGKVEIDAYAHIEAVYSALGASAADDQYLIDENGEFYTHDEQSNNTFANEGTVALNGQNLVIDRITPGDRVDFGIAIDNSSNVAIQYRYKILVASGDLLASAMVLTDGANVYEGVYSYVSEWYNADANAPISTKIFSLELPVYAGNKYQEQEVVYTVLVEAVQGNGVTHNEAEVLTYVAGAEDLADALVNGGEYVLVEDIDLGGDTLYAANNTVLDLNGNTVSAEYITATGNVIIANGALDLPTDGYIYTDATSNIVIEDVVITSEELTVMAYDGGTIAMKDVTFVNTTNSNPVQNYGGTLILDNVTVVQAGDAATAWYSSAVQVVNTIVKDTATGKYQITSQANTIIESGNYTGKKAIMVSAPGGNVTINGGTFVGSEFAIQADFAPQNYLDGANYESVITVNGGTFTGNIKISGHAQLVINGGTFTVDPTAYLGAGHTVVDNGNGTWTVQ